ncbi:DUF7831 domain-containing protein [Lichenicoccus roseus]|uniref:DUF7831 domain-containing protein n=1 Tax=Lichenicoccus roseus TaxID=2683649 RepID=A0A5R9JB36_9PROT|nr:hypothetical protein [Lichenicoccus roseus]TLU71448.1 hypothetical protein FE263_16225 [Lichenicoccus roseus]
MNRRGHLLRIKQLTPEMVRGMPDTLFVLDDNMQRASPSDRAEALRREPNVIGLPTRWALGDDPAALFGDADWRSNGIFQTISDVFDEIEAALVHGRTVVVPSAGFGQAGSDLPRRAPEIHAFITGRLQELETDYPG